MKTRCLLTALFGLWFMVAPWAIGYTDHPSALWISEALGALQIVCSLWALGKGARDSIQNLIVLITGLVFAVMPFTFLHVSEGLFITVFGMLTIVFSFWNLGAN